MLKSMLGRGSSWSKSLGVQRVPEKELNHNFLGFDLGGKTTQAGFIVISGRPGGQLVAEFFGKLFLEAYRRLIVNFILLLCQA